MWTGPDAAWPRHPLRALSGGRRLPRRHRTSHRHGCGPGDHRPSAAVHDAVALRRPHHPAGARWRLRDGAGAVSHLAPLAQPVSGLPIILVGGVLTAHLAFWITGVSFDEARTLGWTFQPPPQAVFMLPWHTDDLARYPWFAIPDLLGNVVAVIFVTASSTLFNTTGIEVATHREANLECELNVTGAANILTGMLGGYPGCSSTSRSMLNFSSGGRGRLSGLTAAALSLLVLAVAPELLGFIPKCVLGGLLLYLGADQLHKWIIESRKRLSKLEYLSLIAIIAIIVAWGFVPGILIGVIIGCATFAFSAARVESIKYSFDGSEYRSSLDRSRDDQDVLLAHGARSRASISRAISSSAPPTGSTSTSSSCCRNAPSAAICCLTSSSSPAWIHRLPIVSPRSSAAPAISESS